MRRFVTTRLPTLTGWIKNVFIRKLVTNFIFSWSRVLNHIIIGEEVIGQQMGGKMRDKDRNTVKEKFSVSLVLNC
jgi:hypothetical protein